MVQGGSCYVVDLLRLGDVEDEVLCSHVWVCEMLHRAKPTVLAV